MNKWNMIIDVAECTNCNLCTLAAMDEYVGNDWPGYTKPMPKHGHKWINILQKERGRGVSVHRADCANAVALAGGVKGGRKLKAVIPGGSSVPVMRAADMAEVRMDFDSLAARPCAASRSYTSWMFCEPRLEVMMMMVFRKSILRPNESVILPSSRICSSASTSSLAVSTDCGSSGATRAATSSRRPRSP